MNETVNIVTAKTTEIGQRTWGIMKGVMALASQKVEEYTKEGANWKADGWQGNESGGNGYYQEFSHESKGGWNSGGGQSSSGSHFNSAISGSWDDWDRKDNRKGDSHFNSVSSGSWDDWDHKDNRKAEPAKGAAPTNGDGWSGWDDEKDDGFDNFYQSAPNVKAVGQNGKSDAKWTDGGFL